MLNCLEKKAKKFRVLHSKCLFLRLSVFKVLERHLKFSKIRLIELEYEFQVIGKT